MALALGAAVGLAGCSGGSSDGTTVVSDPVTPHHHHHQTAAPTPTPTPTETSPAPVATVTVTSSPVSSATPVSTAPRNLTVTLAVRKQLVQAGADTHQLPASDYTGLVPGMTYYAYDPKSSTYWAGAGLVPSASSQDAQISVQDDGSYLVFKRHGNGIWAGYDVGLAGIAGARCQIKPPNSVLSIWHWDKNSCRPPT